MDTHEFIEQFQDYLAPKLDTYEQALYLYIFRHGRLLGAEEVVIGFKAARRRMAAASVKTGARCQRIRRTRSYAHCSRRDAKKHS